MKSRIRAVIGQTYLALNLPQQAQAQLERAQKLSADPPSSSSSDSLSVDIMIAQYQVYAEIGKLAEAEDMARRVVEIRLKNNAADSEPVMSAKHFLAHLLFRSGKYAEARDLFDENLKYRIKSFGEDSKNALRTQASVAACHVKLNEYAVAEKLYESLLPKARATKDTFVLAYVLGSLAEIRVQQQRLDEAQVLIDEAMTLNDKLFGADHTESIGLVGQSAILAAKRQDWPKALQRFQKVYDSNLRINGPVGISTVSARHNLAVAYYKIKELDKGEAVIKDQLKEATAALGDDNLWIRRTYNLIGLIGDAYSEQGQTEDGLRMQRLVLRHILAITEMPEPKPADLHRAAVFLADTKHSELRNLPRALEFIERAVRLQSTTQEPKVEIFEKDLNRIRGLKQSSLD